MARKTALQTELKGIDSELKNAVNSVIKRNNPSFNKDSMAKGDDPQVFILPGVEHNVKVTFAYVNEHTRHVKGHVRQYIAPENKTAINA